MTTPPEDPRQYTRIGEFRIVVEDWMDDNAVIPDDIRMPGRGEPLSPALKEWAVQFKKKLGAKGWIAPDWPVEYGGGGLTRNHARIIEEELRRRSLPTLGVSLMHAAAIRAYGTEEQKTTLLASLLRGEVTMVHAFNELGHGSDLSANETSAVRDGDEFLINGRKDQITSLLPPDLVLTLAVTDPDAPPAHRFSVVVVDARAAGLVVEAEHLLVGGREFRFLFTDVPVSTTQIVGEEGQGIEIAEMMVAIENSGMATFSLDRQEEVERREPKTLGNLL